MTDGIKDTIGCDLGDKFSDLFILTAKAETQVPERLKTTQAGVKKFFSQRKPAHVVLEASTHSRWVSSIGIHDVRSIDATFNVCCPAGEVAVTAMMKCGDVGSRMASAELVSDRCATLSCGDNNVAPTLKLIRCLNNVAP